MTGEEKKQYELERLKEYCVKNGVPTHAQTLKLKGIIRPASWFVYNFGSWDSALRLIGFRQTTKKRVKIPKEKALEDLKKYFQENGVESSQTYTKHCKELGLPSAYYFIKQFGSWRTTVELTGFEYNPRLDRKEKQKYRTKIKFGYKFTPEEYDVIEKSIELAKSEHKTFTKAFYEICKFYLENNKGEK